ncbi:unnamed protein product [Chondrus crispus]|uniref:Uncharacterized protein n=1 Tax=Chondrus crispus TaxID=2769 RepID=R7Q7Y8_CHOCR|nr:unnamed protein product [Chondrus crispus]CDF34149.1 unnamed protein product [Chondrus crispus]|eukprot:XP_005713968.1 unnamed protein product [Chondrus crispus]
MAVVAELVQCRSTGEWAGTNMSDRRAGSSG